MSPADYKAFLDLYGPGAFDGFLGMDRPVDGMPDELQRLGPGQGASATCISPIPAATRSPSTPGREA
ncbi:hypothetical protein ACH4XT_25675 [Streptomyces avidinii]|uniref:hypothetical protein n=1 Tax=Streptomyces avidinii TaxID=1895 RepID=UPI0037BBD641